VSAAAPETPRAEAALAPGAVRLRSFHGLVWRNLRARPLRSTLTACGIALGIALMFGTGLLTTTIGTTFHGLFDAIYGRIDLAVTTATSSGSIKASTLRKVRAEKDVRAAYGILYEPVTRLRRKEVTIPPSALPPAAAALGRPVRRSVLRPTGEPLNLVGQSTTSPPPPSSRLVSGRRARRGHELAVEARWLQSQHLRAGDTVPLALPAGVERFKIVGSYRFRNGGVPGQSFGTIPIAVARRGFDQRRGFDEIDVVLKPSADTREAKESLQRLVGDGLRVETPRGRADSVLEQLAALRIVLAILSALGAFVGVFLVFNAFSMTVFERQRELGIMRAMGARSAKLTLSVLLEVLILGLAGTAVGLALGWGVASGLVSLAGKVGLPLTNLRISEAPLIASIAAGLLVSLLGALRPAWRAGRSSPLAAIAARGEARRQPRRSRALLGALLICGGAAGAWALATGSISGGWAVVEGGTAVALLFLGAALLSPFLIVPTVAGIIWPWRAILPVESRLAANATTANPGRSAATATTLVVGLGLITAFGTISASFLGTVSRDLHASAGGDLTVQPRALDVTSQAPQQTFSPSLGRRIAKLPQAAVVTPERFFFTRNLLKGSSGVAMAFDPRDHGKVKTTTYEDGLTDGQVLPKLAAGQVAVSDSLAQREKIHVGDRVRLRGTRATRKARVAAISRGIAFGGRQVQMALHTMRALYGVRRDSRLLVKARSKQDRKPLQRAVGGILDERYPQLGALTNSALKNDIDARLKKQLGLFNILLFIAVYTSLFGLAATIAMSVLERTREIGVLRALGCSGARVRRSIACEGVVLALIGASLGNVLGLGLGYLLVQALQSVLPSISYSLPLQALMVVNAVAITMGLLASIVPARRAARMTVTTALAYE
jgi:putative ABC transport system permease protein